MAEGEKNITLIHPQGHWTDMCIEELGRDDFIVQRWEPDVGLLTPENTAGHFFIIGVPGPTTSEFEIVRKVSELGGDAIVLAGRNAPEVSIMCLTLARRMICHPKTADFTDLRHLVNGFFHEMPQRTIKFYPSPGP